MHKKKGWASTMQLKKIQKSKRSAGFTLIELLIVIIIIGILAAIAFVAYTGSQNKAKKASAEATLSQTRSKLAEYNSEFGNYPATEAVFTTWLGGDTGGNNDALAAKIDTADFTYNQLPNDCNNVATPCTGYSLVAEGDVFSGTDITVGN